MRSNISSRSNVCPHKPAEQQIQTLAFLGIPSRLFRQTIGKIYASRKEMIRQSKAEKILGKTEKAVHLLERGIAVGHGIYRIGQALAPVAAALV